MDWFDECTSEFISLAIEQINTMGFLTVVPSELPTRPGGSVELTAGVSTSQWGSVEGSALLAGIILLAGAGTGALFLFSVLAYRQRRSMRYMLVMAAVGALFFRTIVGFGTVMGVVPMFAHHLIEHTFDFLIAAIILTAVVRSKPTNFGTSPPTQGDSRDDQ